VKRGLVGVIDWERDEKKADELGVVVAVEDDSGESIGFALATSEAKAVVIVGASVLIGYSYCE